MRARVTVVDNGNDRTAGLRFAVRWNDGYLCETNTREQAEYVAKLVRAGLRRESTQ